MGRPLGLKKINGKWVQTTPVAGPNGFVGSQAALQAAGVLTGPLAIKPIETDAQIDKRIRQRFNVVETMTKDCIKGACRCLIVSGPGGMSKSYLVERLIRAADPEMSRSVIRRGFSTKTGLYRTLLDYQGSKNVVVWDDCDAVFKDEEGLNILKVAADTTEKREIYYGAETNMVDSSGQPLPTTFEFRGSLIFLTNYDFEDAMMKGTGLSVHFGALMDRAQYISIGLKTVHDYLIRIKQVVHDDGMLKDAGFEANEEQEIIDFIEAQSEPVYKFRQLTMRTVKKVAEHYRNHASDWKKLSAVTLFKNGFDL